MDLEDSINKIAPLIGNTTLFELQFGYGSLFAKLEYLNFMGSIKDRPAFFMLRDAIEKKIINQDTIIIESTSGNFGIALAGICKRLDLKFIPVIDPNISKEKESLLRMLSYDVIKVDKMDFTGGYLLTRLTTVNEFLKNNPLAYNPNQYQNENNYLSYYHTLGKEICDDFDRLDYVFIGVSSGGTITGLSRRLKEKFPNIKVIAVDVMGSLIFSNISESRKISGIGASLRTPIIEKALIDDIVILSEMQIVEGCHMLLKDQTIFAGGSSGAVYYAANELLTKQEETDAVSLMIFPDKGNAYLETIYNAQWVNQYIKMQPIESI